MATATKNARKESLVTAAKARAEIHSLLFHREVPANLGDIFPVVEPLGYDRTKTAALLDRMARGKLIEKVDISHPDYKVGYVAKEGATLPTMESLPLPEKGDGRKTRKSRESAHSLIDVKVNEKAQSLTIRAFGMVLRISKED